MRASAVAVTLILAAAAYADEPAAWQWPLEARIAKRIDPASMRERAAAKEKERNAGRLLIQAQGAALGPTEFIVEGHRNPELLMQFELFDSVLDGTDPRFREEVRKRYRDDVTAFGWEEVTFWQALETAASDYHRAHAESLTLYDRLSTSNPPERRELQGRIDELGLKQCRLRFDAL